MGFYLTDPPIFNAYFAKDHYVGKKHRNHTVIMHRVWKKVVRKATLSRVLIITNTNHHHHYYHHPKEGDIISWS